MVLTTDCNSVARRVSRVIVCKSSGCSRANGLRGWFGFATGILIGAGDDAGRTTAGRSDGPKIGSAGFEKMCFGVDGAGVVGGCSACGARGDTGAEWVMVTSVGMLAI